MIFSEKLKRIGNYRLFVFICLFFSVCSVLILLPFVQNLIIRLGEVALGRSLTWEPWQNRLTAKGICGLIFFTLFQVFGYLLHEYFMSSITTYEKKKDVLFVCGLTFLISLPLFMYGLFEGHDTIFHFLRICGMEDELSAGHFPVKMQPIWYGDYGYPVSIYYGDFLLYLPAELYQLGFTLVNSYKIFIFFINLLTVIISYVCFSKIYKNKTVGMILTLIFTTATYRLFDVYTRSAVGEFCGIMFFPIITLSIFRIYTEDISDFKAYSKNAVILALGMSCLVMTHILSTEMVCIFLFGHSVVMYKKTFRKQTLIVYGIAVLLTIFITAGFLIPFLDYFMNVRVRINLPYNTPIQCHGAYVTQFFAFFQGTYGYSKLFINYRPVLSLGVVLTTGTIIGLLHLILKFVDKKLLYYTCATLILLFMSTNLFPYDFILKYIPLGKLLCQIQFPWRWLAIATVPSVLLFGRFYELYQNDNLKIKLGTWGIIIASLLMTVFYVSDFVSNRSDGRLNLNRTDYICIDTYKDPGCGEYCLVDTDINNCDEKVKTDKVSDFTEISRNGTDYTFSCRTDSSKGFVELPIWNYRYYEAKDENGNKLNISDGFNRTIRIEIPDSFNGKIFVGFKEPLHWRISEIISLVSVVLLGLFCIFRFPKSRKQV